MTFKGEAKCLKRTPMPSRPDTALMYCADIPEAQPKPFHDVLAEMFMPNPNRSWEQARRFEHADLAGLSDVELWKERMRAESILTWLPEGDHRAAWIAERLRRVRAERERREHDSRR